MPKYYSIKGKCYFCEKDKVIEHHISYAPEIVVYLCKKCHGKLHILIKKYQEIIKKIDKGRREINVNKLILNNNEIGDIKEIMNMPIKRVDKVKLIAEAKCITERHARRLLNKLEQIEDETEDTTSDNRT